MPASAEPYAVGQQAECAAQRHLARRGWRICACNWIGGGGELDIVASRWRTLLVAEVRRRIDHEVAGWSVDAAKLERTRRAAHALIRQHGLQRYRLRIDLFLYDAQGRLERRRDIDG